MSTIFTAAGLGALVAIAVVSNLDAPSQAVSIGSQRHNNYYYKSYDTAFRPACVLRDVRSYDTWGKSSVRKVRVCH